jgi:penicillin-binding protein 1A
MSSLDLEQDWRPSNYSGKFYGEQRLREALVRSMNLATVRLLLDRVGINNAIDHIKLFGFNEKDLPKNGGLALGAGSASPLDMAQAYSVFANGGYAITPYIIDSIRDVNDKIIYSNDNPIVCPFCEFNGKTSFEKITKDDFVGKEEDNLKLQQMADIIDIFKPDASAAPELFDDINLAERIISEDNAFLIKDMLQDVIRRGTGVRANRELRRRDIAGKTGTTNDYRDAWFAGFNDNLTSIVWVGNDNNDPLGSGEQGSRTALPIWIELMRSALKDVPEQPKSMPNSMVTVRISKKSGCPASPDDDGDVMFEIFSKNGLPTCENESESIDIFN